ncbi:MAG: hypothetical protein K2K60_07250 [Clostridia bacterium]|nr:hypothetical protein [Clostridia bacterium]
MENTFLFELFESKYIDCYREKLEKDNFDNMPKRVAEARDALEKTLNEDQLKLFKSYLYERDNKDIYINLYTETRIFYYGIKIGMILQEAFEEYDDF